MLASTTLLELWWSRCVVLSIYWVWQRQSKAQSRWGGSPRPGHPGHWAAHAHPRQAWRAPCWGRGGWWGLGCLDLACSQQTWHYAVLKYFRDQILLHSFNLRYFQVVCVVWAADLVVLSIARLWLGQLLGPTLVTRCVQLHSTAQVCLVYHTLMPSWAQLQLAFVFSISIILQAIIYGYMGIYRLMCFLYPYIFGFIIYLGCILYLC